MGIAAVASIGAPEVYQLEVLAHGIQTIKENYPRFIALGREPVPRYPGPAKTSLISLFGYKKWVKDGKTS